MIPQPAIRQIVAIAGIAIFLALLSIVPLKPGFERFVDSLACVSATWLVISLLALPVAFFARPAFPPRGSLPRLEVSRSCIRVVPGRIARLFAEAAVEIALSLHSREILLCHSLWQGYGDGLRLVVRDADGAERQIRATAMDYLGARDAQMLADGVSAAVGLPVRLLTRSRQADGSIQEASWRPPSRRARMVTGAAQARGFVPLVGGAVVGGLWPAPAAIPAVGLGLWMSRMGLLFLLARCAGSRAQFPTLYSLTSVFTFGAT